ncbi:hypothetical protein Bealeia1_01342 [Candidatus Bealeia paramacronuclearis]|uniref:Uncharacterized protein n=1 Tax=Candidatus Bealeia paramacronuclearis TaxID=1921001 RepID=A0ABZ2C5Z1_9PROT|nr:hypothetical protein [Candidatus Bealeia paramacronuclearis]
MTASILFRIQMPLLIIFISFSANANMSGHVYFKFINNSSYDVTIKKTAEKIWDDFSSNTYMIPDPLTLHKGKSSPPLSTYVSDDYKKEPATLSFSFSSPYHAIPVTFFNNGYKIWHTYGAENGDYSLGVWINDPPNDNDPMIATITFSDRKPHEVNFQFKNTSSYPVTITWNKLNNSCWSPGPSQRMMFTSQTVFPGKTLNLNKTQTNDSGTCLHTPSELEFTFSSPYHSVPVTFTYTVWNNTLIHKYGTEHGDSTLGLYTDTSSPNIAKIEFVDRTTPTAPITLEFSNGDSGCPSIEVEELGSTCWDTNDKFPLSVNANQFVNINTHTYILKAPECKNSATSVLNLKFSGQGQSTLATLTRAHNKISGFIANPNLRNFYPQIIPDPSGNKVKLIFKEGTGPCSNEINSMKPLQSKPLKRPQTVTPQKPTVKKFQNLQ